MVSGWLFFLAIWIALFCSSFAVFRGECARRAFFRLVSQNHRLDGYTISTQNVHSTVDCHLACLADSRCTSCNFHVSGNPLHICELNNNPQNAMRSGSLQPADGCEYYEIVQQSEEQPCETNPCKNNGTCTEECRFPYYLCHCPPGFKGVHCAGIQDGNFVIKYNRDTMNSERVPFLTRKRVITLSTVCVWVKPNKSEGFIFTYATENDLLELGMSFTNTTATFHLVNVRLTIPFSLPLNTWSHLCFNVEKRNFRFFYNGFIFHKEINMTVSDFRMEATDTGYVVLGAKQTAPGIIDYNSIYDVDFYGFFWWVSWLSTATILHMYNQPYFTDVRLKTEHVDWRQFYDANMVFGKTVIYPSDELHSKDDYLIRFSGRDNPTHGATKEASVDISTLSITLWFKTHMLELATVLRVKSGEHKSIVELSLSKYEFRLSLRNQTWSFNYNFRRKWYNLCITWDTESQHVYAFIDGYNTLKATNRMRHETIYIDNPYVEIGGANCTAFVSRLNIWHDFIGSAFNFVFDVRLASALALEPGRAHGNLFSWDSIEGQNQDRYRNDDEMEIHYRENFDIVFPSNATESYMSTDISRLADSEGVYVMFWLKIARGSHPFTVLSLATPDQLYELNIHFGAEGIWIHIGGEKRLQPFDYRKAYEKWHQFGMRFLGNYRDLRTWWNLSKMPLHTGMARDVVHWRGAKLVVGNQQIAYGVVSTTDDYQYSGKISQLHIWDQGVNFEVMRMSAARCTSIPGNVVSWSDLAARTNQLIGNIERHNDSQCLHAFDGEKKSQK